MPFIDPKTQNGLGGISLPDMSQFQEQLSKQLKQSAGISKIEVIKLGNPASTSGADSLYVASNPNYLYYTTEGEEGAGIGMISKEIVPPSLRFPNKTLLTFRYGSYVSVLAAAGIAEEILSEASPTVSPNQTPVSTSQLDFATLQPLVGTMQAVVKGAIYGDIGVPDLVTADFSASPDDVLSNPIDIPTNANKAIGVLVQLDPATATLSYKQSAEFPASLSLAQAYQNNLLPLRDDGLKRTGYIKLSNGITSLDNSSVWTNPEFFPESANASELVFDAATELTVASGEITVTQSWHTIDTESNAATDELDTINGLEAGRFYFLQLADAGRVTKLKHGTGNIKSASISDVNLSTVGCWIQYDGTDVNVLTHSLPNDVDTWGAFPPDASVTFMSQDSTGEAYAHNGEEMKLWSEFQFSSGFSIDAVADLHLLYDSATAFTMTINAGSIIAGMAWEVAILTAPGAGTHDLLLPSGVTFDGTNRRAIFNSTSDFLEGKFISSTRFLLKPTTTGVTYSAS